MHNTKETLVGEIKTLRHLLHAKERELLELGRNEDTQPEMRFSGQIDMRTLDDEVLADKIIAHELSKHWAPASEYFVTIQKRVK